ncbi:MAG: DUF4382 domain-containing protein [Candidatus Eisenbacteria bacterium]
MSRRATLVVLALSGLVAIAALVGCSQKSSLATAPGTPSATGYGLVTLHIIDAPAMYDQINLDVQEVWVHRVNDGTCGDTLGDSDGDDDGGQPGANDAEHHHHGHHGHHEHDGQGNWIQLSNTPGVIDLLALQDGVFATLGTDSVPAGTYNQIRLVLGANNSIVVDSVSHPLEVPSACRSGYKLIGHFVVPAEGGTDVGIDFDAARSIHQEGNGDYVLIPVVRIVPLTDTGNIAGIVKPIRARAWVFAIQGADTVTSTRTRLGRFTLSLLPAGDYTVSITPTAGFRDTSLTGVSVAIHRTTDVGVIQLTPDTTASQGAASPARLARR